MEYALRNSYTVVEQFGGTYESAHKEERREFERMIDYLSRSKADITHIVVYSYDRFARNSANGAFLASELKKRGVLLHSVMQPADPTTHTGTFQQNLYFAFAELDYQQRREKTMAGTRERLRKGLWVGQLPPGYEYVNRKGEQGIVVNKDGELIRQAFLWRANEGMRNADIQRRLEARGLKLSPQKLCNIFANPFYCGVVLHASLDYEPVKGAHEPLVTERLFRRIHEMPLYPKGTHSKESGPTPLRHFVRCAKCRSYFSAYEVKKKRLHYYKCTKQGCNCNRSAVQMHGLFRALLAGYAIDERFAAPFQAVVERMLGEVQASDSKAAEEARRRARELKNKLEKLEERWVDGEFTKEIFEKHAGRCRLELAAAEAETGNANLTTSNLPKYVSRGLEIASRIQVWWENGDFATRQKLQLLVFPEGVFYDRDSHQYLTPRVNIVFDLINRLSATYGQEKRDTPEVFSGLSLLAGGEGFEPPVPCGTSVFKTDAIDHSAIPLDVYLALRAAKLVRRAPVPQVRDSKKLRFC